MALGKNKTESDGLPAQPSEELSYDEHMRSGDIVQAGDVIGDGFTLLEDKTKLIDVPFLILHVNFSEGDYGEFATLRIITEHGDKFVVNDGSTGIREQCYDLMTKMGGEIRPIHVPHGLRVSRYNYLNPATGKQEPASTFYLDTQPA